MILGRAAAVALAATLVLVSNLASVSAQERDEWKDEEGDEDAAPAESGYGTHGFMDRVSKSTEEVDRCTPRIGIDDKVVTRRAGDHFARGVVLYEQGDYAAAIGEFVSAYCDKPHPTVLYNIGQAYERMIEYEKAVAYLERFIIDADENAPDRKKAQIRVEVLRQLPARILVATAPPNAEVTLSSDTGVSARARADGATPLEVRKGTYEMRIELPGYEPVVKKIVAEIGRPYSYYFQLDPKKGVVRVVATPADARIFLGDRLVGFGSYVETVAVGRYRISVEAEGRPTQLRSLEVNPGKTTDVTIDLGRSPKSGRWELVLASGLLLGGAAGGMADTLFDKSSSVASLVGVGGVAIGFGGAYLGVPEDIPVGYTSYIVGSTVIGAAEGAVTASIFAGEGCFESEPESETTTRVDRCDDDLVAGATVAGAAAGATFASLTAGTFDPDAGDAALVNSGALWGTISGLLFWSSYDRDERVFEPLVLAGLNLGVVVGATLAARSNVSRGRVSLIDLAGLGGAVLGFAVGQAFDSPDERLAHATLVGMGSGLIAGTWLTRNYDEAKTGVRPTVTSTGDRGVGIALVGDLP